MNPEQLSRIGPRIFLAIGLVLLGGAGFAAWSEIQFLAVAVETDGRVEELRASTSRDSNRQVSTTYAAVFTFALPDGRVVRAVSRTSSDPPCCEVGEVVRVLYDPERPERAQVADFLSSWLVTLILGTLGVAFTGAGIGAPALLRPPGANLPWVEVPLVGLRHDRSRFGSRWVVQARWTDPRSGASRLFQSWPLTFDPVPQMQHMQTVRVRFDPKRPQGEYKMDLSFLKEPAA
jgi:hypothetical protein